jgi:hypothetical protein
MSEASKANQPSPFATTGGKVPSSALVGKLLREISDVSGQTLDESTVEIFCDRIRESARVVAKTSAPWSAEDRAESFYYILLMAAYAVDASLLNADPLEPMWSQPYRLHFLDWGGASPDGVYRRVMLRDDRSYRIYGRLGNAKYLSMDCRQSRPMATFMPEDLAPDSEGNFELFLGGAPRDAKWRPLNRGTSGLVLREFFDDWSAAKRSHLRIDCLDGAVAPRQEYRPAWVAAAFDLVGEWVLQGGVRYWVEESERLAAKAANTFLPGLHRADTKLPVTTFSWIELADDEALIIELTDPEAAFWAMHFTTSWWRTLDYANRITTFNMRQAHCDPDGLYRFVVSGRDPGIYNWLDTTGLTRGVMILRFCGAKRPIPPSTKLVKLADVAAELATTRRCSPAERRAQIAARREGVAHMICD